MNFWEGIVEDRDDPLQMGRVRVRIFGHHSSNKDEFPTDLLPWANIILPTTNASNSGIGSSPTGMTRGTRVIGFFYDSDEGQQPTILGSLSQVHLDRDKEVLDSFSSSLSQNSFIPEQETLETTPTEVSAVSINPGESPSIENSPNQELPRQNFNNRSSVSEITTNNQNVENSSIQRKIKPVEEGGNLDLGIKIAFFECESYEVILQRSTNSNKADFISYSNRFRFSTNIPSTFDKFPPAINGSKDSNNDCIYTNKIKNYSNQNG